MRRRIGAIVTVVVAVVVFAAAGYVIFHNDPVRDAGKTPGGSIGSISSAPSSSAASASASASASVKTIAFLGDDYTNGVGSSTRTKDFVSLIGSKLGAKVTPYSVEGGGYAKESDGKAYADRVAAIVADKPAMVVVTGGRNDVSDDESTLNTKATDLFASLHQKLPDAVLVAVAPFWGDSDAPSDLDQVDAAVKKGVQAVKGTYLDLADPLNGHPSYMASDSNPNDKGYQAIADALTPKLLDLLPKS